MVWVQLQISWQFWCLSIGHLLPRSTRRQRWRTTTSTWPSTSCSRSATSTPYDSNFILVKIIVQRSWFPGAPQHILKTEPRRIQAGLFVMIFVISKILIRIFVISTPCSWPWSLLILDMVQLDDLQGLGFWTYFYILPSHPDQFVFIVIPMILIVVKGHRSLSLSVTCWRPDRFWETWSTAYLPLTLLSSSPTRFCKCKKRFWQDKKAGFTFIHLFLSSGPPEQPREREDLQLGHPPAQVQPSYKRFQVHH